MTTLPICEEVSSTNLLENYKPREKKVITVKCLGCMRNMKEIVLMNQIIKRKEEFTVKQEKCKPLLKEVKKYLIEVKLHLNKCVITTNDEKKILEELNKLMIEQEDCVSQESFDKTGKKINKRIQKHREIEKKRYEEKKRSAYFSTQVDKYESEIVLLYDEMKEDEKRIEIDIELLKSMKSGC